MDRNERIQVFDLERSLLNTLTDPDCNGGLRGVLEAWERGLERASVPTLIDYLCRFERGPLWRRTGVLAKHLGIRELVQEAKRALERLPADPTPIPLVIGRSDGNLLHPWHVIAPW